MAEPTRSRPGRFGATIVVLALIVAVVVVDQITKRLVVGALAGADAGDQFEVVSPWLAIDYVENRGAVFGLFQGSSDLLLVLAVLLVIGIGIVFQRMGGLSPLMPAATGLILGGALGNIIDRVRLGFVIDFIAVGPWPKFNVADSAISVGVALLIVAMLFGNDPAPRPTHRAEKFEAGQ